MQDFGCEYIAKARSFVDKVWIGIYFLNLFLGSRLA